MFKKICSMRDLQFSELMSVYEQTNREIAEDEYSHLDRNSGLIQAEQFAYQYLKDVFFQTPGAFYAVWIEKGKMVSAMRMEPYRDGWLLEGLETAPEHRRKGYATSLMQAVLQQCKAEGKLPVYSHIAKKNRASICAHKKCGFICMLDYAVEIDGSLLRNSATFRYL